MRGRAWTWAVLSVLIGFAAQVALGIGPENQTLTPTFDGVVRMLYNNGNADGTGYMNGTGTIVDNVNVNGQGWLCVLTADHVVSQTGTRTGATVSQPGIAFGNSAVDSGDSLYIKATPEQVYRRGPNGLIDIALLGINYGAFDANYTPLVRNLVTASAFFDFTDIGYGNEGKRVAGGYQAQNRYGTERYFNEKIVTFNTTFSALGYTYDSAQYFVQDPTANTAPAGSGTTFDADSGSPYFTTEADFDEANGFSYFTNNQFAVHTGSTPVGNPPAGFKPDGSRQWSVALSAADLQWIAESCALVPEPGCVGILIVWGAVSVAWRRRAA